MQIPEDNWVPISAVSHYSFCPRRCALIHEERVWAENDLTASGKIIHKTVDAGDSESRKERRIARSFWLASKELGICGIADVVEFFRNDNQGVRVGNWTGLWIPHPVEYKRGTAKNVIPYERQLCAQAICLEEMFNIRIPEGYLYLNATKHRRPVCFDEKLREETRQVCVAIHYMFESGVTPFEERLPRCKSCSLVGQCMPGLSSHSVHAWLKTKLE